MFTDQIESCMLAGTAGRRAACHRETASTGLVNWQRRSAVCRSSCSVVRVKLSRKLPVAMSPVRTTMVRGDSVTTSSSVFRCCHTYADESARFRERLALTIYGRRHINCHAGGVVVRGMIHRDSASASPSAGIMKFLDEGWYGSRGRVR